MSFSPPFHPTTKTARSEVPDCDTGLFVSPKCPSPNRPKTLHAPSATTLRTHGDDACREKGYCIRHILLLLNELFSKC